MVSISEERRKDELWVDPSIPLPSVAKLLKGPDFQTQHHPRHSKSETIPLPKDLRGQSRELKKLRSTGVWINGTLDEQVQQMDFWFPSIDTDASPAHKKAKVQPTTTTFRSRGKSKKSTEEIVYQDTPCPTSDIGILSKLPGELRNRIYRMATLSSDPIRVEQPYRTCGIGRCLHAKVSYNVPGIAQTCKQLRWEALPIYLAENPAVQFDAGTTYDSCTLRFMESLGHYADLIPKYTFILQRPIWILDSFQEYANYHFSITTPKRGGRGQYMLEQWESAGRKICQCAMEKLVKNLNEEKDMDTPNGKAMLKMMDDDDFSDFVWRMKKSKQWPQHLAKCPKCKEIMFNN